MEKQEEIKEMARIMCPVCNPKNCDSSFTNCVDCNANTLAEAGIGDTKKAVINFAEKLQKIISAHIDKIDTKELIFNHYTTGKYDALIEVLLNIDALLNKTLKGN